MVGKHLFRIILILLTSTYFLLASNYRWELSLLVEVKGSYEIEKRPYPIRGEYILIINWKSSMEKDNGDYLLYKGEEKIIEWKGKETIYNLDNFLSYEKVDLSNYPPPQLNVNYLLKKENIINLDFNFSSFLVPYWELESKRRLIMPCSAQNEFLNPHLKYNRNIIKGSNKICFEEKELYAKKKINKTFTWQWRRTERTFQENELIVFLNFHTVNVKLEINPE